MSSSATQRQTLVAAREQKAINPVIALLRCGSCRFAAFYFLSFYVAILDSSRGGWLWLLFSALIWTLHSLGTELVNRLSDEVEDRINRPERTALCDLIGYRKLKFLSAAIWSAVACLDLIWLWMQPNLMLAALLFLAFLSGLNYSYGVRFKRKRYLSLFALTFPFAGPFIVGWSVDHNIFNTPAALPDLFFRAGPFVVTMGLLIGSIASAKDITDIKGDELIGYLSIAVGLIRRNAVLAILALVSIPFIAISTFVSLGLLPARFFVLLLFMPVSLFGALCICASTGEQERLVTKEAVYQYWFILLSLSLFLYFPTLNTFWVIVGTAIYWFVASQYLHWTDGIRLWKVRLLLGLLRRLKSQLLKLRTQVDFSPDFRRGMRYEEGKDQKNS
jgi:4-hydroxybenzoate polyprenyltransferase